MFELGGGHHGGQGTTAATMVNCSVGSFILCCALCVWFTSLNFCTVLGQKICATACCYQQRAPYFFQFQPGITTVLPPPQKDPKSINQQTWCLTIQGILSFQGTKGSSIHSLEGSCLGPGLLFDTPSVPWKFKKYAVQTCSIEIWRIGIQYGLRVFIVQHPNSMPMQSWRCVNYWTNKTGATRANRRQKDKEYMCHVDSSHHIIC